MRKTLINLSLMLIAGGLAAQTPMPVAKPAASSAKPTTAAPAKAPAAASAKAPTTGAAKAPAVAPAKAAAKPASTPAKKAAGKAATAKPAANESMQLKTWANKPTKPAVTEHVSLQPKTEAKPTKAAKPTAAKKVIAEDSSVVKGGRRDPFLNPVKVQSDRASTSALCTTGGSQCLVADQVNLLGIVKTQKGMIAMVENAAKKQYNLHENDPVLNGKVVRITRDSVVFRENTVDNVGKASSREVVKKVTVPVV